MEMVNLYPRRTYFLKLLMVLKVYFNVLCRFIAWRKSSLFSHLPHRCSFQLRSILFGSGASPFYPCLPEGEYAGQNKALTSATELDSTKSTLRAIQFQLAHWFSSNLEPNTCFSVIFTPDQIPLLWFSQQTVANTSYTEIFIVNICFN